MGPRPGTGATPPRPAQLGHSQSWADGASLRIHAIRPTPWYLLSPGGEGEACSSTHSCSVWFVQTSVLGGEQGCWERSWQPSSPLPSSCIPGRGRCSPQQKQQEVRAWGCPQRTRPGDPWPPESLSARGPLVSPCWVLSPIKAVSVSANTNCGPSSKLHHHSETPCSHLWKGTATLTSESYCETQNRKGCVLRKAVRSPSGAGEWLPLTAHICFLGTAKSLQLCPTLHDPMDCSLPGSSVHGIFQARVLEWGAIAFSGLFP